MSFLRHSHSVQRPGDPSVAPQPELPAFPLLNIEVPRPGLVHRQRTPRRQEPATPSWTVAFLCSSHPEARWLLFPLRRPRLRYSRGTPDRSTHLEPPLPPHASHSHLPPYHRRPTESNRRRPSFITHAAFFTLTTIAFPAPFTVRTTIALTRAPARCTSISPRDWNRRRPPPPELSTVTRVRAWGSANPRNAVQGHML